LIKATAKKTRTRAQNPEQALGYESGQVGATKPSSNKPGILLREGEMLLTSGKNFEI
jgi:hypothetical protein